MIKIRKAKTDDIPDILEIWKDFMDYHKPFDPFWSRKENAPELVGKFIKTILKNEKSLVLVAEYDKKIIGYQIAQLMEHPPILEKYKYCLINDIAVVEEFRGQGIGKLFFIEAVSWSKNKGIDRIELQVAAGNKRAIHFYEKLGLKPYTFHMYLNL